MVSVEMRVKGNRIPDMDQDQDRQRQEERAVKQEIVRGERYELLHHIDDLLEPVMVVLGLVFLVLLLMDFASVPLVIFGENRLGAILQGIWVVFLLDFLLRFWIAPDKLAYLRQNWLGALSLALPFLRPLRIFRVARVLRQASLLRFLGGINRGMRILRQVTRGRQFAFVAALTVVVVLAGAVGVRYFDQGEHDSPIQSFGDALWWSATLVTTMNSELYVVSLEARVIGILQRLYALSVFGYITASIATYLIGSDAAASAGESAPAGDSEDVRALREEIAELRRILVERG